MGPTKGWHKERKGGHNQAMERGKLSIGRYKGACSGWLERC
jgi:hypothetical protein